MITNMKKVLLLALGLSTSVFSTPNSIIAIVNDELVTYDTIANDINNAQTTKQKLVLVNKQVDLVLKLEKIKELGLEPKPESVNAMLNKVALQNKLSAAQLQASPQFDQIVANIKQKLSLTGLKRFVLQQADIKLSQTELSQALKDNPSKKDNLSTQVKIAQIVIASVDNSSSLLESQDSLIQAFMADLVIQLNNGKTFSALAKLYSQDASYKDGGELGWLMLDKLPNDFISALSNLDENKTSAPFKTQQGWRIIKLLDERSVDNHISAVKVALLRQKQNVYFANWVKSLREKAYIEILEHKF